MGETDNLPDPLQGFYDQAFHPDKVAEEVSDQAVRDKYDVEEASEDLTNIVNETKNETPPTVEETPEEIEWEGMIITPIEGLRFDKGTFYAEAGNPYGLEVGEKAGIFVKDAVEINGGIESAIGLVPKVIEVMQKEIMEEEKKFVYPFLIDLEQAKGIKIKEVEFHEAEINPEEDRILNKDTRLEISNVPLGTIIYAPSSSLMICLEDTLGTFGGGRELWFDIIPGLFKEEIVNNHKIDYGTIVIRFDPKGVGEFIPQEIEKEFTEWRKIAESDPFLEPPEIETKIGIPLVKVIDKVNLKEVVREERPEEEPEYRWLSIGQKETDFQIEIYYDFYVTEKDGENDKGGKTGLRNLLEIGEMKVFILSAYD